MYVVGRIRKLEAVPESDSGGWWQNTMGGSLWWKKRVETSRFQFQFSSSEEGEVKQA